MSVERNYLKARSWSVWGLFSSGQTGIHETPKLQTFVQPGAALMFSSCGRGFGPEGTCSQAGPHLHPEWTG